MAKDIYTLDENDANQLEKEVKGGKINSICPKHHGGDRCYGCEHVQKLFQSDSKEDKEQAYQLMAKVNFFVVAVFPEEKNKFKLLQLGKIVGNQIINGVKNHGWTDIVHPKKGKGRLMMIDKSQDGKYAKYQASADLKNVDWDIPKEVLDNLPDLRNIVDIFTSGKYEIYNISSLKTGESVKFRICPDTFYNPDTDDRRHWIEPLWRHWGLSSAQLKGDKPINEDNEPKEKQPWKEEPVKNEVAKEEVMEVKKPNCFGESDYYDPEDDDCKTCDFFKKCGRSLANG